MHGAKIHPVAVKGNLVGKGGKLVGGGNARGATRLRMVCMHGHSRKAAAQVLVPDVTLWDPCSAYMRNTLTSSGRVDEQAVTAEPLPLHPLLLTTDYGLLATYSFLHATYYLLLTTYCLLRTT